MNTLVICRKRGWKRRSRSNNASAFLSFFAISLVFLLIICSISTAYFSVPVWAANPIQCLIWELITTLTVASGSAPVNNLVNQAGMASDLGSHYISELASGEYSVAQCDAAIQALTSSADAASQAAGGIAQSFATTAADVAQAAEAIAASGVEGVEAAEGAMSAGENLANCAAASVGAGSIVGMLGMEFTGAAALGAGAVAVVAGVGLGIIGHNVLNYFKDKIRTGMGLDDKTYKGATDLQNPEYGFGYYEYTVDDKTYQQFVNGTSKLGNGPSFAGIKFPDGSIIYHGNNVNERRYLNGKYQYQYTSNLSIQDGVDSGISNCSGYPIIVTDFTGNKNNSNYEKIMRGELGNNTIESPETPDIVSPDGNISYDPINNTYNYNYNNNPTYNTTNNTLKPIYNNEYNQFIQQTQNNFNNNIDNSQTFQNFINNYLDDVTVPAPDTDPDIPEQPVKPTVTPNTPEQVEQNKEMMLPVDLKDYFPFCIPFDIYVLMTHFEDIDREAPKIDIDLDLGSAGEYTINVDLSDYDDAASLLRALELIAFIIGLMVAARKLIGD